MGSEMKSKGKKRRIFSALLSIILCLLMVGSSGMVSYAYNEYTFDYKSEKVWRPDQNGNYGPHAGENVTIQQNLTFDVPYKGKKLTFNYTAFGKTRKIIDDTGKEVLKARIDFTTGYRITVENYYGNTYYYSDPVITIKDTSGEYTAQFATYNLYVVPKTGETSIRNLYIYKTPESPIEAPEGAGHVNTYGKELEQPPEKDEIDIKPEVTGKFTVSEKENFKDYVMGYEIGFFDPPPKMMLMRSVNRSSRPNRGDELSAPHSYGSLTITVTNTYHTEPYKSTDIEKIGGGDRIETSEKVSKKYFSYADNVIIARKDDFPDALTANVLAKALNAPILITDRNRLDERIAAEIKRLGAKKAYIIGRENAISEPTEARIKQITGKTERIGGSDRYETSSLVAKKVVGLVGRKGKAVIATGQDFADSLSISPYAAKMGYPILLVKQGKVPETVSKAFKELSINESYIVGGDRAVSGKLEKDLPKLIERIGGSDRYETSAKIADKFFTTSNKAFLASGQVFADALVIGPVATNENTPILLTQKNDLPKAISANIARAKYDKITIVGRENAVSKKIIEDIRESLQNGIRILEESL